MSIQFIPPFASDLEACAECACIGYTMYSPVSFGGSLIKNHSIHVGLLLPLILDVGPYLAALESAYRQHATDSIVHPWIAKCSILLFGLIIIRHCKSATFTITDLDSMALY